MLLGFVVLKPEVPWYDFMATDFIAFILNGVAIVEKAPLKAGLPFMAVIADGQFLSEIPLEA